MTLGSFSCGDATIYHADVLNLYEGWEPPTVIVSDGPYGLNRFYGDLRTPEELPEWYEPHIKAWSEKAIPQPNPNNGKFVRRRTGARALIGLQS